MKRKTKFFNRKQRSKPILATSRYERSFYHNNKPCSIVWGFNKMFNGAYIKRVENYDTIFHISTFGTIVPHPNFPNIIGEWSSRELAAVFDALWEWIPLDHRDAVRRNIPF